MSDEFTAEEIPEDQNPDLVFRDTANILPHREWIRRNCERYGIAVEDIDLILEPTVLRIYGEKMGTDEDGKIAFVEIKHTPYKYQDIKTSKRRLWGKIDKALREYDPDREWYQGYYLLCNTSDNWDEATVHVNGKRISDGTEEGRMWLKRFCELDQNLIEKIQEKGYCPLTHDCDPFGNPRLM